MLSFALVSYSVISGAKEHARKSKNRFDLSPSSGQTSMLVEVLVQTGFINIRKLVRDDKNTAAFIRPLDRDAQLRRLKGQSPDYSSFEN